MSGLPELSGKVAVVTGGASSPASTRSERRLSRGLTTGAGGGHEDALATRDSLYSF